MVAGFRFGDDYVNTQPIPHRNSISGDTSNRLRVVAGRGHHGLPADRGVLVHGRAADDGAGASVLRRPSGGRRKSSKFPSTPHHTLIVRDVSERSLAITVRKVRIAVRGQSGVV